MIELERLLKIQEEYKEYEDNPIIIKKLQKEEKYLRGKIEKIYDFYQNKNTFLGAIDNLSDQLKQLQHNHGSVELPTPDSDGVNFGRLSPVMIKWIKCKNCRQNYFENYPNTKCIKCGSYEYEEVDDTIGNLLEEIKNLQLKKETLQRFYDEADKIIEELGKSSLETHTELQAIEQKLKQVEDVFEDDFSLSFLRDCQNACKKIQSILQENRE